MSTLANLRVKFDADTSGFERGAAAVDSGISKFAGAALAAAGAYGLGALFHSAVETAGGLVDLNKRTNVSIEMLSAMRQATSLAGTDLSTFAGAALKLQTAAAKAAEGNKKFAAAFEAVNINAKEFAKLSPDEQVRAFAEAYSKLGDDNAKLLALTTLMGKGATKLKEIFEGGAAGIDSIIQKAKESNQVIGTDAAQAADELADRLQVVREAWTGLQRNAMLTLATPLLELIPIAEDVARHLDRVTAPFRAAGVAAGALGAATVQTLQGNFSSAFDFSEIGKDIAAAWRGDGGATLMGGLAVQQEQVEQLKTLNESQKVMIGVLRKNGQAVAQ